MTYAHLRSIFIAAVVVSALSVTATSSYAANGIRLDIIVNEHLDTDPPESAVIDSVSYPVLYSRKTILRAGNFVVDVTAQPGSGGAVDLATSLYVSGPLPGNRSDDASIAPGAAMLIDEIRGKGKSRYSARLVPHTADVPADTLGMSKDSTHWEPLYSLRAQYFVPKGLLPPMQFLPVRSALDFEFQAFIDTFALEAPGRLLVYLPPGNLAGHPYEPLYGYSIDPSRYIVIAHHTPFEPHIRPRALVLAACYRAWGYAPQLLSSGVAGYFGFSDYNVIKDRAAGHSIRLDSLARTMDYKRHDRLVADHHAESFITWLISTYGIPNYKSLYERATDQSIHRAIWSVYNQTLAELESKWLAFLKARQFDGEEFMHYATRAVAFRDFETHLELLEQAAVAVNSPPTMEVWRNIGLAQGQLGRWEDAAKTLTRLITDFPDEQLGRWLLAEAQRASGEDVAAWLTYLNLLQRKPSDPQTALRMGDIQWDARRVDSAATFWRRGLSSSPGPLAGGELKLRMGWYFQERRKGQDSARAYFADARRTVTPLLVNSPTDAAAWIIAGEALLGLDSVQAALEHLALAQAVTDAPIELGRIHLLRGKCYDRLDRRKDAVAEYQSVEAVQGGSPMIRQARKWLNRPYGH